MNQKILLASNVPESNDKQFGDFDVISIREALKGVLEAVSESRKTKYDLVNVQYPAVTLLLKQASESLGKNLEVITYTNVDKYKFAAGFFIGGDQKIVDIYETFKASNPSAFKFPIPTTGGAARFLYSREGIIQNQKLTNELNEDSRYLLLAKHCLECLM